VTRRRYDRYDAEAEVAQPSVVDLDVRVPRGEAATLGLAFGVLVTLLTGWVTAGQDVSWWVVPVRAVLAGLLAGWGLFFVLFGLHTRDERRDRKQQRAPQMTDWHVEGETEPRQWAVTGVVTSPDGRRQVWARYEMVRPRQWYAFCKAVEAGRNFSENEAMRHEVAPADWQTVKADFESKEWYKLGKRRGTPELHGPGKALVKAWATTPPPA